MSSSSGIQHRGSLDQYSHSTCSTVNDPTCYFDKESNQVRKWDEQTLHSADAQRTVQNETDVNEIADRSSQHTCKNVLCLRGGTR
eukprot:m.139287 g.139287  ORF g.139287 m.139287 type:complete len:85 (-) comp17617_c0_seq1:1230-1484(-)